MLFKYNTFVGSPLFGRFTQLSVIVLALFTLFTFVGVVKHSAFGMNLSVLDCAGVIDGGETTGLSKTDYVDGVVYSFVYSACLCCCSTYFHGFRPRRLLL